MDAIVNGKGPFQLVIPADGASGTPLSVPFDLTPVAAAVGATTTQTGADQVNAGGRGVRVILDMTAPGTGSVTLSIQGKDPASGKYYNLLTGAAVTTVSTNVYDLYPGIAAVANQAVGLTLPRIWRIVVTANNANATSYTVGGTVLK